MRAVVLLSAGRHPVSGRPVLPRVEAQAIRLALAVADEVVGLHAGPDTEAVAAALGHGLARIEHRALTEADDPVPSLVAALHELGPDLVLAGRRGVGGDESGLVPYLLAKALGWSIVADVAALSWDGGALVADQALPRGMRRRFRQVQPLVLTVHPAAAPPLPFAFGRVRRGEIRGAAGVPAPSVSAVEERAMRPRAKLMHGAGAGGSAADRLKAATESARAGGQVLVEPAPEAAAQAILDHLRRIGALERSQ